MEERECVNCINYVQHYRKGKVRYHIVGCGHCMKTWPNGMYRKTNKICEHYKEKE